MNLNEIKNQIYSISDYKPGNPTFEREVENLINNAYMNLWNAKPWTFATKKKFLDLHVDITPERTAAENGETDLPELIPVSISSWSPFTADDTKASLAFIITQPVTRLQLHPYIWKGNPIEIDGMEYTITAIRTVGTATSQKTITVDGVTKYAYVIVYVDSPIRLATATTTAWKIKQRYVYLPDNVSDIISVAYRPWPIIGAIQSWNVLTPIDTHVDSRSSVVAWGNQETTGHARSYVREPEIYIPPGGKISYTTVTSIEDTSGSFSAGESLELAWAYVAPGNIVGPIGEATKVSIASGVASTTCWFNLELINFDGSQTVSHAYLHPESHSRADQNLKYDKQVFYNANWDITTGKRLGPPRWIPVSYGATQTVATYGEAGSPSIYQRWVGYMNYAETEALQENASSYGLYIKNKYILQEEAASGQRFAFIPKVERIRLWPRPDGSDFEYPAVGNPQNPFVVSTSMTYPADVVQRLEITYRYTPHLLSYQTDAPECPGEFSQLIAYSALRDIYLKNNNVSLAQMYDGKYERLFKDLAKRHVTFADNRTVKGGLNISPLYGYYHNRVVKTSS